MFRVLIFTILVSFTQRMSIQSACIQQWFRFKLLANFDFYLCLCINFHTLSFWVLILAASGPYWVLNSQKNGSLSQSLGVFISFRGSALSPSTPQTKGTPHTSNGLLVAAFRFKSKKKHISGHN